MIGRKLAPCLLATLSLALAACGTVTYERAHVVGFEVSNLTLGRGVAYELPSGYTVLDPRASVPLLRRNAGFEDYLRGVAAKNETPNRRFAFNECLLFKREERYVVIFHAAINFPTTFAAMPPEERSRLLPILAEEDRRYFATPNKDYRSVQTQYQGNDVIEHLSFLTNAAGPAGKGWIGTGFSFVGDVTDLVSVFVFSKEEDAGAAQEDRQFILKHFNYGPAAQAR